MGGVYLLGIQPGTRVYNNLIHDVSCRFYGGWALYTDEGSAHMVLERNVCFNCTRDGYHQHYGRENIVRYNIFAFNANSALAITSGNDRRELYELPGTNYRNNLNLLGNVFLQAPGHPFFRAAAPLAVDPEQFSSDCNFFHGGSRRKFAQVGEAFLTCSRMARQRLRPPLEISRSRLRVAGKARFPSETGFRAAPGVLPRPRRNN